MKKVLFSALVLASLSPLVANLRAPFLIEYKFSRAIQKPAQGVIAQKEELNFDCEALYIGEMKAVSKQIRNCKVNANYYISVTKAGDYSFEFVLPTNSQVLVSSNSALPAEFTPTILEEVKAEKWPHRDHNLYKCNFTATLKEGENTLLVQYSQPMNTKEVNYGYMTKSEWRTEFGYELWPLKEWQKGNNFSIKVQYSFQNERSTIERMFGSDTKASLFRQDKDGQNTKLIESKLDWDPNLQVTTDFGKDFPDVLLIKAGSQKYIKE